MEERAGTRTGGAERAHRKEQPVVTMSSVFTMFAVFLFLVVLVPVGLILLGWLFQPADTVSDPEWERYQQRYD